MAVKSCDDVGGGISELVDFLEFATFWSPSSLFKESTPIMFSRSVVSQCPRSIAAILGLFLACSTSTLHASVLAQWTFEKNPPFLNNSTTIGSISPEVGTGTASGLHASAATDWSNPAGNGSDESFSSNTWTAGDYYQFQTSSTGYQDVTVSWAQTRSSTGPNSFVLFYSTDGVGFTNFVTYSVPQITWSAGSASVSPLDDFSFGFNAVPGLDNKSTVYFLLVSQVAGGDAAGTSRVDNFTIEGTAIPTGGVVPEPASFLVWGGVGLLGLAIVALKKKAA